MTDTTESAGLVKIADDLDIFVHDMREDGNDASALWLERRAAALRRLAAQDQKPVAWRVRMDGQISWDLTYNNPKLMRGVAESVPLYLSPPPAAGWDERYPYDDERFNKGVQHVVDLIARELGVKDWVAGDGSEDYDCDLWQTILNILSAKGIYNKDDGEFANFRATPGATKSAPLVVTSHNSGERDPSVMTDWGGADAGVEARDSIASRRPNYVSDLARGLASDALEDLEGENRAEDRTYYLARWFESALSHQPAPVAADPLDDLVARFSIALLKKLKLAQANGRSGWEKDGWEADCQRGLLRHVEKGDPRDVAAYCAFMWHHGWITSRPAPVAANASAELEDARAEAADSLRILDAIAEYVGCPHDEELTVDHVRKHYARLEDAAQRQGVEDANRFASAEARLREALDAISHADDMLSKHIEEFHDFDYLPGDEPHEVAQLRGIQHHLLGSLIDEKGEPISAHPHASDCDKQGPVPSGYGEYTPITVGGSTSDRTADVTVDELHAFILKHSDEWEDEGVAARALLDAFTVGRQ